MPHRDMNRTSARDSENVTVLNQFIPLAASQNAEKPVEDLRRVRVPLLDEPTNVAGRVPHANRHHDITGATKDMPCIAWPVQTVTSPPISNPRFQATSAKTEVLAEAVGPQYSSTVETSQFSTSGSCGEPTDAINNSPGLETLRCRKRRRTTHVLSSGLVIEVEATGSHGVTKPLDVVTSTIPTASPELTQDDNPHDDDSHPVSDESASYAYYSEEWDTYPPRQRDDDYFYEPSEGFYSELGDFPDGLDQSKVNFASATAARTASPEPFNDGDSHLASNGSAIFSHTYPPEWDVFPPRQGGDYYFEQQIQGLRTSLELFYHGDPWKLKFIPTVLRFLGTRSNPWDWSGDAFMSLLRRIWTTVYRDTAWSDDDANLVCSLATESVTAWFESFASEAMAAVELYLKRSTEGLSTFSEWSMLCKEMVYDSRLFYEYPDGMRQSQGIYGSPFVLAPLAGHMKAIEGGTEVRGVPGYEPDHELDFPFGAIGLAAAAAFRAALLVSMELVAHDGDETLVVKEPTNGGSELPTFDTSFTESTAGGTTRQFAAWAQRLHHHELTAILARANTSSRGLSLGTIKSDLEHD